MAAIHSSRQSWGDALHLTQCFRFGLTSFACVYTYSYNIVRDSRDANATTCDNVTAVGSAKGFRLPTSNEWELAGRYKDGSTWTPGNYTSGATAAFGDKAATNAVSWNLANSASSTHPVGEKNANVLNLRDMSGNVWEWCFDCYPGYSVSRRVSRGGGWNDGAYNCGLAT